MTPAELLDESNRLNTEATRAGFVLRRQHHEESDLLFNVYYEAKTSERRIYGEGASWEEAIIEAARKAIKASPRTP